MVDTPLMIESEAAEFLRLAVGTLQNRRIAGTGPAFVKLGSKVGYLREDLIEYLKRNRRTSTSDTGTLETRG